MVERAAAGEASSSPQPPEAGARRARLYGVSSAAENRNRQTLPSSRRGAGLPMWRPDRLQPTLNMWLTCPWRRGADLAARLRAFDLPLADLREDGAEVLVLDDGGLRVA